MKDAFTNGSYVAWIGSPQVGPCRVQEVLWKAGAVFYARTTQPQAVMRECPYPWLEAEEISESGLIANV